MAARLNPFNQETVKQKIKAGQLVERLQKHALSEIEMTPSQIDAAKFLLNKRLSNAPTEMNVGGQEENPLNLNINQAPKLTKEEWLKAHGLGTATRAAK